MHSKAKIFNLALGMLLLARRIIDTDTDPSNEAKVLNVHYDVALSAALEDMDLDGTSSQITLELVEQDPTDLWGYAYKYPSNCAFFRRLQSSAIMDKRSTHVPRRIAIHDDQKVIFTNQESAIAEFIPNDVPINSLSANAGLCVAAKLAILSAPLATGKGALKLIEALEKKYVLFKAEAQDHDRRENFNFVDPEDESEFVEARLE